MLYGEKILRSLMLAGVEWELKTIEVKVQNNSESFAFPKSVRPLSNSDILEIATRKAEDSDIITAIKSFSEHPLYKGAKNTVFPEISGEKILVITDIPSSSDDKSGTILSGDEGELFDKMMSAIGLSRREISITPLVFWRPAGGRTPTADEVSFCKPFIQKIIKQTKAHKILTLGQTAAEAICGAKLRRDHGKEIMITDSYHEAEESSEKETAEKKLELNTQAKELSVKELRAKELKVIPIYKPDFIIKNPNVKKAVWEALKQIRDC